MECPARMIGEPFDSALSAPVQRQMRVGDQFVRGGIGGLFAVKDRCDNVPRKEVQADQASGGAGLAHVFMGGDVFDRGARIVCKAFAEDIGANEKSDRLKRGNCDPVALLSCTAESQERPFLWPMAPAWQLGRARTADPALPATPRPPDSDRRRTWRRDLGRA
jgi:hypothetical protein